MSGSTLLVNGAKYKLWKPDSEKNFAELVKEHLKDIFGFDCIYFDIEPKLRTGAGIGTKPDGILLTLGDEPCLYIVEYELSTHPLHEHIVAQMSKFNAALKKAETKTRIVDCLYDKIKKDPFKKALFEAKDIKEEIHKFLSDLIRQGPKLVIIIDERTPELYEVMRRLPFKADIIEFKTFVREEIGIKVHAHLFNVLPSKPSAPTPTSLKGFWDDLLSRLYKVVPSAPKRPPSEDIIQWLDTGTGLPITYVHFEWWIHRRKDGWFEIGLHFEKYKDAEYNREALRWFMTRKNELERRLGETLYFKEKWGEYNARLYVRRDFKGDILQATEEFKTWIIETTKKFYEILGPELKKYREKLEKAG